MIYVEAFGLPLKIAAIAGGIYRLVDIGNATVNVMGDPGRDHHRNPLGSAQEMTEDI